MAISVASAPADPHYCRLLWFPETISLASTLALRANFGVTFCLHFTTNLFLNSLILSYIFFQDIRDNSLSRTIGLKV